MLRSSTSLCLSCRPVSVLRLPGGQIRAYAQAQRSRPSRMTLSNRVSDSRPARPSGRRDDGSRPPRRDGSPPPRQGDGEPFKSRDRNVSSRPRDREAPFSRPREGAAPFKTRDRNTSSGPRDRAAPFSRPRDREAPFKRRDNDFSSRRRDDDTPSRPPREQDGMSKRELSNFSIQREAGRGISEPRGATTTPRKERRAAYFADKLEGQEESAPSYGRGGQKGGDSFPLWAPANQDRKRRPRDGGLKTVPADRPRSGPFGALNQRTFRSPIERGQTDRSKSWAGSAKKASVDAWKARGGEITNNRQKPTKERDDYHSLKMQQALATVSYGARNQIKNKISEVESFEDFPLLPAIQKAVTQDALKALEEVAPTPIQKLAIPALLGMGEGRRRHREKQEGMQQFLLAAETGSGKTMAYLLPAIDAMKRAEVEDKRIEEGRKLQKEAQEKNETDMFKVAPPDDFDTSNVGRPKVIILVPTAELVEQVGQLAKALSHEVKFRTAYVSSNYTPAVIKSRLFSPMDILVSTPHLLASVSDSEAHVLGSVTTLVVDEADSLLDRSFSPITSKILDKATPTLKQLVLCSATIPKRLDNFLRERFPDIKRLTTPNLHAIPRRVQLGVVDVEKDPYKGNKDLACADVIWKIGSSAAEHAEDGEMEKVPTKRLIVFVNEREKSVELAEYLAAKGIDAVALNRDLDTRTQTDLLGQFCSATLPSKDDGKLEIPLKRGVKKPARMLPNTKVLVCTDIASRGIDTTAVRHVVLYDVPHTSIDFIHRLGRTGRMGRRGRGVVLVGRNDRKDVVREIREAMFRGAALI